MASNAGLLAVDNLSIPFLMLIRVPSTLNYLKYRKVYIYYEYKNHENLEISMTARYITLREAKKSLTFQKLRLEDGQMRGFAPP